MMDRNSIFRKRYGSSIDYNAISNIEQLHAARERLRNMIELKEFELGNDVKAFKEVLNPVTYINRLVSKLYSFEYLVKYFVQGYEFVRNWFNGRADGVGGAAAEAAAAAEEEEEEEEGAGADSGMKE